MCLCLSLNRRGSPLVIGVKSKTKLSTDRFPILYSKGRALCLSLQVKVVVTINGDHETTACTWMNRTWFKAHFFILSTLLCSTLNVCQSDFPDDVHISPYVMRSCYVTGGTLVHHRFTLSHYLFALANYQFALVYHQFTLVHVRFSSMFGRSDLESTQRKRGMTCKQHGVCNHVTHHCLYHDSSDAGRVAAL